MSGPIRGARCVICDAPNLMQVNAAIRKGTQSTASIAAEKGVSKHALYRHVQNGHVGSFAPTPTAPLSGSGRPPGMAYEFSDDEEEAWEQAVDAWAITVADASGLDADAILAHYTTVMHTPEQADDACPECDAADRAQDELFALVAYNQTRAKSKPGRWVRA
jgi:hypothetical protein